MVSSRAWLQKYESTVYMQNITKIKVTRLYEGIWDGSAHGLIAS